MMEIGEKEYGWGLAVVENNLKRYGEHWRDEFVSAAHLGMTKAVEKFDPDRGVRFKYWLQRGVQIYINGTVSNHVKKVNGYTFPSLDEPDENGTLPEVPFHDKIEERIILADAVRKSKRRLTVAETLALNEFILNDKKQLKRCTRSTKERLRQLANSAKSKINKGEDTVKTYKTKCMDCGGVAYTRGKNRLNSVKCNTCRAEYIKLQKKDIYRLKTDEERAKSAALRVKQGKNRRNKIKSLKTSYNMPLRKNGALPSLEIIEARRLHKDGITIAELARKYNCSCTSMSEIVNYKRYKYLP